LILTTIRQTKIRQYNAKQESLDSVLCKDEDIAWVVSLARSTCGIN